MSQLTVSYLGQKVGTLAEIPSGIVFEYERAFIATGQELSPFHLPLGPGVRARGGQRLHGLFDDSLPDAWGRRVMLEWFRQQGTPDHAVTPLAMLAYVGSRGMGALTYEPARDVPERNTPLPALSALHEAAMRAEGTGAIDLNAFAAVGSSAGGARPKALLALPIDGRGPLLGGMESVPATHEAWLVKFDTSLDGTHGSMEEAYARMARAAGVGMPETQLLETRHASGVRRHFAVKRFDREGSRRFHHHTLASLSHLGGGDLSYEMFLRVTRRLTQDEGEVWHAYRRAVFNVFAGNRDDHGKNHGFLYRDGKWKLGPAYDLNFASPQLLPERGMSISGQRLSPGRTELVKLAEAEGLDRRTAAAVIDEVREVIARWHEFAGLAGVPEIKAAEVGMLLSAF